MKVSKKKKGFTLMELIIVIAIIGILAAIAVPKFSGIQADAKVKADIASAKVIADAAYALIAQGNTTVVTNYSAGAEVDDDILSYIQIEPEVKAVKGGKFTVKIDAATEDVHVKVGEAELYPTHDDEYPPAPSEPDPT